MPEPSSAATAALLREQLRAIGERLELQRVAAGVEQEHRGLLAGLAREADRRLDHEARAGRRSRRCTAARTGRAGFRRMGLKEPSAARGSPKRGTPAAKGHSKRPGLGTRRAKRRRKRARPGTRGSHVPPAETRVWLGKTRRRDSESQPPVEKRWSWYWGESRAGLFVQCEWHPGCEAGVYSNHSSFWCDHVGSSRQYGLDSLRKFRNAPASTCGQGRTLSAAPLTMP